MPCFILLHKNISDSDSNNWGNHKLPQAVLGKFNSFSPFLSTPPKSTEETIHWSIKHITPSSAGLHCQRTSCRYKSVSDNMLLDLGTLDSMCLDSWHFSLVAFHLPPHLSHLPENRMRICYIMSWEDKVGAKVIYKENNMLIWWNARKNFCMVEKSSLQVYQPIKEIQKLCQ